MKGQWERSYRRLLRALVIVLLMIGALLVGRKLEESSWRHKIDSLIVGRTAAGWHRQQAERWAQLLQEANPQLDVPATDVDSVPPSMPREAP